MKKLIVILLLALLLAFPVRAQEPYKVYLPVILSSLFNQDNNWRIIQPVGSTNYTLNPSGEASGNYTALAGTTVTRSTTYQKYGLYSYRVETNADNEGIGLTLAALANANHFVTMRVRGTLPAAWDWSLDNSVYTQPRLIEKIDGNWNLYGLHIQAAQANGSTTLYIRQRGAGAGDFYLDGIQVEPLDYWTTYIDGTQEGCAWIGAPHAAPSERSAASRAGGQSVDFWTEYGFQIRRVSGAGAITHSLSIDSYAMLPGGELNSDEIQSREFTISGEFVAETESALLEQKRALESAFYAHDSQLTRIRFNGAATQKELAVRYRGGLEGDLAAFYGNVEIVEDEKLIEHQLYTEKAAIQVTVPYPYWQEVGESAILLDTSDSATYIAVAARLRSLGQWSPVGPPNAAGTYNTPYVFAEDATYIYIGGDFENWDNIANADNIVRYNKSTGVYSAMGGGLNGPVTALAIAPNGDLYIGGAFTNAGGVAAADYLTRWDGGSYNAVGTPVAGAAAITGVFALAFSPLTGDLYIGGTFDNWANIANADNLVRWNGSNYNAVSTGANDSVIALAFNTSGSLLYIGGNFTTIGGVAANRIASWNYTAMAALSTGMNSGVGAIVINKAGEVYIAGAFTTAGGVTVNYVTMWNRTAFVALDGGTDAPVHGLSLAPDNVLYAVGEFTRAGDLTLTDRAARWNGYAWAHLDIDLPGNPNVYALYTSRYSDPVMLQKYDIWIGLFFPVGDTNYGGLVVANNEGSVSAFPKIIFNRSGGTTATIATLRNENTGKELLFNYPLLSGETLVVDLNPTQKSIISSCWGPRPDAILANSDFGSWALAPGSNNVTSFVITTGSPTITAYMLWRETYSSY